MDPVFERTRQLAEAILESEPYQKMKAAEAIAMKNAKAAMLMSEMLEARKQVELHIAEPEPDSDALKALSVKMEGIQAELQKIDEVQALTRAREAFSGMMNQVNQVLRFIVTGQMTEDCTGECGSCSGGCSQIH